MSNPQLNKVGKNWDITASRVYSNSNTNLTLDASGNSSLFIKTNGLNRAIIGKDISGNSILTSCVANFGTVDTSNNISNMNTYGTYFSNGISALKIPADSSNNRPSGQVGYMRYNTDVNLLEYWDPLGSTSSWKSTPSIGAPTITALSSSSTTLTINFNGYLQGIAKANITNSATTTTTLNIYSFSGAVSGGQYTIILTLTGTGSATPTLTITPPTVASSTIRFNFATLSITTSATAAIVQTNPKYIILTIAYDGTNYYISGSGFNN